MEIKDKIKSEHFRIYAKHSWPHKPSCICHQWEAKPVLSQEIIAEVKRPDTSEEIEYRSFETENIKAENLGF